MGHVRDRWMVPGPNGRKIRSERWGHGARWQARWEVAGKAHSATFASKDAAELHLARVSAGLTQHVVRSMTVAEYGPLWLAQQLHYSRSTATTVAARFHAQVYPHLGAYPVGSVSRADMQAAVAKWSETLAPASVHQLYSFVTVLFKAAAEDGLIETSPCVRVNLPPLRKKLVVPLTVDQVEQVADRVVPWMRSMVLVGAATGMRGGELRGLTVDRVLGDDVRIDRQLLGVESGRPVFGPTKSKAGERRISLTAAGKKAIEDHLSEYGAGDFGLIWRSRQGGPVVRTRSNEVWRNAVEGLGFRERTGWHDLRHHHASLLIAAGLSPRAVADRLGHADAAETLRTYSHLWEDDETRLVQAVDAALSRFLLDRPGP